MYFALLLFCSFRFFVVNLDGHKILSVGVLIALLVLRRCSSVFMLLVAFPVFRLKCLFKDAQVALSIFEIVRD